VRKVTPAGVVTTVYSGLGEDREPVPEAIAIDAADTLYSFIITSYKLFLAASSRY
jgi:hypothetical protein